MPASTPINLRHALAEAFSLDEMDVLCADLGIDPERIPYRERGKEIKANWIVIFLQKHNDLARLIEYCSRQRPAMDWANLPVPDLTTEDLAVLEGAVVVTNITIAADQAHNVSGLANPYLGLSAFTYADRDIYAGREREIAEAITRLASPGRPTNLLFITGASGSGKSSFVQAGVLPALEAHYTQRHLETRRAICRPSLHPIAALDDALQQLGGADLAVLSGVKLLVIDQFEEIFTQADSHERSAFLDWLAGLPKFDEARTHVIVTVRSDYLDALAEIAALWPMVKDAIVLRAMSVDELMQAIQRPLQQRFANGERRFGPGLVDKLAQDAHGNAAYLPLLQVSLAEIWKRGSLVLANYSGLADAITQRADAVYAFEDFDASTPSHPRREAVRAAIIDLFLNLINVSLDDDARRNVRISRDKHLLAQSVSLDDANQTTGLDIQYARQLIDGLTNARLLSTTKESDSDVVNIIHEALIRDWVRLHEAISKRREKLQQRTRLEQQIRDWITSNSSDDYLLRGIHLAQARELDRVNDIALKGEGKKLLQLSIALHDSEQLHEVMRERNTSQRLRVLVATLVTLSVLALVAMFIAIQAQQRAVNSASEVVSASGTREAFQSLAAEELVRRTTAEVQARNDLDAKSTAEAQSKVAISARATQVAIAESYKTRRDALSLVAEASRLMSFASKDFDPQVALRLALHSIKMRPNLEATEFINTSLHSLGTKAYEYTDMDFTSVFPNDVGTSALLISERVWSVFDGFNRRELYRVTAAGTKIVAAKAIPNSESYVVVEDAGSIYVVMEKCMCIFAQYVHENPSHSSRNIIAMSDGTVLSLVGSQLRIFGPNSTKLSRMMNLEQLSVRMIAVDKNSKFLAVWTYVPSETSKDGIITKPASDIRIRVWNIVDESFVISIPLSGDSIDAPMIIWEDSNTDNRTLMLAYVDSNYLRVFDVLNQKEQNSLKLARSWVSRLALSSRGKDLAFVYGCNTPSSCVLSTSVFEWNWLNDSSESVYETPIILPNLRFSNADVLEISGNNYFALWERGVAPNVKRTEQFVSKDNLAFLTSDGTDKYYEILVQLHDGHLTAWHWGEPFLIADGDALTSIRHLVNKPSWTSTEFTYTSDITTGLTVIEQASGRIVFTDRERAAEVWHSSDSTWLFVTSRTNLARFTYRFVPRIRIYNLHTGEKYLDRVIDETTSQETAFDPVTNNYYLIVNDLSLRIVWKPDEIIAEICQRLTNDGNRTEAIWKRLLSNQSYHEICSRN